MVSLCKAFGLQKCCKHYLESAVASVSSRVGVAYSLKGLGRVRLFDTSLRTIIVLIAVVHCWLLTAIQKVSLNSAKIFLLTAGYHWPRFSQSSPCRDVAAADVL